MDELNRELQSVYASKSWCITLSLRKTMFAAKWALSLSRHAVRWALLLPKSMAKPLVVWIMRETLANHRLKVRALGVLARHPNLKQHLRLFVMRTGLMADLSIASTARAASKVPMSPIANVNRPADAPVDEGDLHVSLVRAMQAWPLGVRKNG